MPITVREAEMTAKWVYPRSLPSVVLVTQMRRSRKDSGKQFIIFTGAKRSQKGQVLDRSQKTGAKEKSRSEPLWGLPKRHTAGRAAFGTGQWSAFGRLEEGG